MKTIKINNFKECLYYEKLFNGFEIFMFPSKNKKSSTAFLTTKFGGYYTKYIKNAKEYNILQGSAHFLEHKLFEQDEKEDALAFYTKMGANCNARTSGDATSYFFTCCDKYNECLAYLLDYVYNLYLTTSSVEKEKGIIIEELKMYNDNADTYLYNINRKNVFFNDNIRNYVGGEIEDIKKITKDSLQEIYQTFYNPSNMFIVLGGNFDKEETLKIIKDKFNTMSKEKNSFELVYEKEPNEVVKEYDEHYLETVEPRYFYTIKMNINKFSIKDKRTLNAYLSMIFSIAFSNISKFRTENSLNNNYISLHYSLSFGHDHVIIEFYGEAKDPDKFVKIIKEYLNNLKITKEDFERIKKVWISSEVRVIDNVQATVNSIIQDIIQYGYYENNAIEKCRNMDFDTLMTIKKEINVKYNTTLIGWPKSYKKQ